MLVEGTAKPAQAAGMSSSTQSALTDWSALLPGVVLEVRQAGSRAASYALGEVDFLIGSLPGCDLRVGGTETAAVICLLARHPAGVTLRKLSPAQSILVNGRAVSHHDLADGERIQVGLVEILVRITAVRQTAPRDEARRFPAAPGRSGAEAWQSERSALLKALDERDGLLAERAAEIEAIQQRRQFPADPEQVADLEQREQVLAERRREVDAKLQQYEADVLRLNRWQGTLEQRERVVADVQRQREGLQRESAEMETQLRQIDEWRVKVTEEADQLAAAKQAHAGIERETAERVAAHEGQQATLSGLRSRLERMREEIRVRQRELDDQRAAQDARENDIAAKAQEAQRFLLEAESQRGQYEQDRQQWLERSAVIETAVRQLKQAQELHEAQAEGVQRQTEENHQRAAQFEESEAELQDRFTQFAEAREGLDLELNALRERSVNLVQREQACENLQEQLRRRAEEIVARYKEMAEQLQEHQAKFAELEEIKGQLALREEESKRQIDNWRQDLEAKAVVLNKQHEELAGFEERYQDQLNQIAAERQLLGDERTQFHHDQKTALDKLASERGIFETMRAEAEELIRQLPDAELRAGTALDRLSHARTQMRDHLAEIHHYVQQCRDEQGQVRARLQTDLDKLRDEEETLRRGQDAHRLAMAAYRQQLIDWQAQIAELRRLLTRDETRLERKKVQADERAREIEAESDRLAKQAEVLDEQERTVADRRLEMDRHLVDMRDWYRRKLRDLAGMPLTPDTLAGDKEPTILSAPPPAEVVSEDGELALMPVGRGILSMAGATDPGDQKLGDVLRDSQLIDADTLTALLAEARRQRRSLRQVLLTSGVITLYQLALIEAGNMQGLMLGAVRVIDRVRQSAHEGVYRVFDPRRGTEAVLRHLSETASADPARADDFRKRFTQAMLNDPHLANTLDVFDLLGRPAVLQEWLAGLPATDWPPLTAAPGVCYRLLTQAAQGLATAHQAGVVHGRLSDASLFLTGDGVLKIAGVGEPAWLVGVTHDDEPTARADLRMLGTIVSGWCTPSGVRKGAKTKPLPEALVSVLYRLAAEGGAGYHDVGELLLDLEKAGGEIPPNAEAWDRLLKYVREHGATESMARQSA